MVWTVTAELYPYQYRATCMSLSTASNWTWNFLIAFFTPFITSDIDFRYGYVFAACCATASVVVYIFLLESSCKTLEEVDSMYLLHVSPGESAKWQAPDDVKDLLASQRATNGTNTEPKEKSVETSGNSGL